MLTLEEILKIRGELLAARTLLGSETPVELNEALKKIQAYVENNCNEIKQREIGKDDCKRTRLLVTMIGTALPNEEELLNKVNLINASL